MSGILSNLSQSGKGVLNSLFNPENKARLMEFLVSPEAKAFSVGFADAPTLSAGLNAATKNMLDVQTKYGLEMEKLKQQQAGREQRQALLANILGGGSSGINVTPEQRRRASLLAAAGFEEEAFKVLTEPDLTQTATNTTISDSQESIKSIDSSLRELRNLKRIKIPGVSTYPGASIVSSVTNRKQTELLDKAIGNAAKVYAQAKTNGKPTESQIHEAKNVLAPAAGESQGEWEKRIDSLMEDLANDKEYQASIVRPLGKGAETISKSKPLSKKLWNPEDLEYTAKVNNISVDEVIRRLEEK